MMQQICLHRTGQDDLCFAGELVASLSEELDPRIVGSYSLALYRTQEGQFVAHEVRTFNQVFACGNDQHRAMVCATGQDVIQFLGYSDMALRLYAKAGIPCPQFPAE